MIADTSLFVIGRDSPILRVVARIVAAFFPSAYDAYAALDQLEGGSVIAIAFDDDLTTEVVCGPPPTIEAGITFQLTDKGYLSVQIIFQGVSILVLIERSPLLVHIYKVGQVPTV